VLSPLLKFTIYFLFEHFQYNYVIYKNYKLRHWLVGMLMPLPGPYPQAIQLEVKLKQLDGGSRLGIYNISLI